MRDGLTLERVKQLVSFNAETGAFTWNQPVSRKVRPGDKAGSKDAYGYWVLSLDGKKYKAHHIAWLYVHGSMPHEEVDHINGVRDDNRISNLRACSRSQNMQNKSAYRNNKAGLVGVSPKGSRWAANINVSGKRVHLGTFPTPEEAHAEYLKHKAVLHTFQPTTANRSAVTC